MLQRRSVGLLLTWLLVMAKSATAQDAAGQVRYELTLREALDLAHAKAPTVRAAQARIGEAHGRLVSASVVLPHNPTLEIGGGPRFGSHGTLADLDASAGLLLELGGQRQARVEAARGAVQQATAVALDTRRLVLRDTALVFLRARHAAERLRLANDVLVLTNEIHRVAERRYDAGDVGVLDVNLAVLAQARARSEVQTLQASHDRLIGNLRILLGLGPDIEITVHGELLDRRRHALDQLLKRAPDRPDLHALDAAIRRADAELRLGEGQAWPDLGIRFGYAREEDTNLIFGTLTIDIPVFDYGQGLEAEARARGNALRIERQFAEVQVRTRVLLLYATYQRLLRAVEQFEEKGLPRLEQTESLVRQSYQIGALPLFELLAVRRELLDSHTAYIDLLLQAALAGVELESETGVLQ